MCEIGGCNNCSNGDPIANAGQYKYRLRDKSKRNDSRSCSPAELLAICHTFEGKMCCV